MIEPTDEMVTAFEREGTGGWGDITDTRAGLAAVLAIVERDRAAEVEKAWEELQPCPSTNPEHPHITCEGVAGHDDRHCAMRWLLEWP